MKCEEYLSWLRNCYLSKQQSALWSYLVTYLVAYFCLMLQVLHSKFHNFKHRIEAGSERITQCEELAKELIASESPYAADITCRQEQLRWVVCCVSIQCQRS